MEGILKLQASGRWAICKDGETPWEITSGDLFYVEVVGTGSMQITRMEFGHIQGRGQYYSVDGIKLRDGLRAATNPGGRFL